MSSYFITFKGDYWDILNSDYYNYFKDIKPFQDCFDIELYQTGKAKVKIINNEPIITHFYGSFEFVYSNKSLGYWEIPKDKSEFEFVCLGLTSIYKAFSEQLRKKQFPKLNTAWADFAIGNRSLPW